MSLLWLSDVSAAESDPAPYIPSILLVEDDAAAADLESRGVIIWRRRADMALALVPRDLDLPLRTRGVSERSRFQRRNYPALDYARSYGSADKIHSGTGLPRAYTGKGVVVGFCDTGFDPNHIAFKGADGKSRVRKLVYYDEPQGIRLVLDTPEKIAAWTTDNPDMFHATHVANIMTGSYKANGYYGMATDAEIVATTSQLYDAGILSACEDILDYAREVGKPAVINLSLGSYNGPHDGSSLFCRYMDLIGEEAVVCMSSGNQADDYHTYRAEFDDNVREWRTRIFSADGTQQHVYGMTDAWSHDERPVGVRLLVHDLSYDTVVYSSEMFSGGESFSRTFSTDTDSKLSEFFNGEILVAGRVDPANGRWVTEIEYDLTTEELEPSVLYPRARYELGLEFSGDPGVHADIVSDGIYSFLRVWPGYDYPDSDMSVSDLATGDNVICIGMYNNRSSVPRPDGSERDVRVTPLTVNTGSGYGTLIDGRVLPHTVAPGGFLVSACNRYFVPEHPELEGVLNTSVVIDGETYHWATDAGTSMSAPFVAGVIATWLEADPTLTVAAVRRIIEATNHHEYPDADNPRHGMGWFSPYDGLKMVISESGVTNGTVDSASPVALIRGDVAEILNPGGSALSVRVVAVDGRDIISPLMIIDKIGHVDLSSLCRGVYLLSVTDERGVAETIRFVR